MSFVIVSSDGHPCTRRSRTTICVDVKADSALAHDLQNDPRFGRIEHGVYVTTPDDEDAEPSCQQFLLITEVLNFLDRRGYYLMGTTGTSTCTSWTFYKKQ